jgi:hypothetical protein
MDCLWFFSNGKHANVTSTLLYCSAVDSDKFLQIRGEEHTIYCIRYRD